MDIDPIQTWEANEKRGYVPPGPRSGVSAGIGIDFAHHTPESLVKMGVDPALAYSKKLQPYLKQNENTLGPRGKQASKTLKEKGLELTNAETDNLNQAILTDNLDRVITSYERHREKNPNAKKFDELPPEIQTVILSRYHHRSSRWNELNQSCLADSNFFKALMQGGDDPVKLKANLADALQKDVGATTNGDIQGRLKREMNYLRGKKDH